MGDEEQDTLSAEIYFSRINGILKQIEQAQQPAIEKAASEAALGALTIAVTKERRPEVTS